MMLLQRERLEVSHGKRFCQKKGNKLKVTKTNKSLLLFGMVAHTVADIFAHSVWEPFYIRGINGGVYTLNDMYKKFIMQLEETTMRSKRIITIMALVLCFSFVLVSTDVTAKVKGGTWKNMKWSYNTKTKLLKVWGNGYMDYVGDLGAAAGWVRYTKTYDATKLVISGNVKSVGYLCFIDYLKVKEVILPKGIKKISGQAFENCQKLKIITLPYGLKKIKDGAFAMTGIEKLVIPGSVKKLEKWSLANIPDLKELILENGVRELGDSFVDSDNRLRKLRLPKSLKKIDGYAFLHCGIKKLTIPINVEEIGFRAFSSMDNIKTVKIKSTKVKKWGKKLFFSYEPHKIKVIVPKSKYKEYKKIILKNAGNKKVKVVKAKKF